MSLEYFALIAFIGWCGTKGPRGPWRPPNPPDPDPVLFDKFISNLYYVGLAGLTLTTAATYPEEALSLPFGPFAIVPAIQVLAGLYYSNRSVPAGRKVKAK